LRTHIQIILVLSFITAILLIHRNLTRILRDIEPDEVYNLGAQSHVAVSFEAPEYTADVDAMGSLRILEAIRFLGLENKTRFYQASTQNYMG
jgi:GDPmannose 4,6-dehydratase